MGEVFRVAHLSDLHFGADGQESVWATLVEFLQEKVRPNVILITGDIVDTPRKALFKRAQEAIAHLDGACATTLVAGGLVVCPGNHDRFFFGNRVSIQWPWGLQFEHYFANWLAAKPVSFDVQRRLALEVVTIDSTENTRFLARGAVSKSTLKRLSNMGNGSGAQRRLRLLLMHHHVLPIAELETDDDKPIRSLLEATTAVANPARLLAALTRGHFDLVLHGHQHAYAALRYASVMDRGTTLTVLAAPSSTGVVTGRPCDGARARFNTLDIEADDSLWLTRYQCSPALEWASLGREVAVNDTDVRRAWYSRATDHEDRFRGVRWFFDCHENHDVTVSRTHCDFRAPQGGKFSFAVRATDSVPSDLRVSVVESEGRPARPLRSDGFTRDRDRVDTFRASVALEGIEPGSFVNRLVTVYRWAGGSRLTTSRIEQLAPDRRDYFHLHGMDSVYGQIAGRVAWIELSVRIPQQWAPQQGIGNIRAYIGRAGSEPVEADAISRRLVSSGDGYYSVRVEYPDVATKYYLAWEVFDDARQ